VIRVNLLPGGKRGAAKAKGAGFSLTLPSKIALPTDRWALGAGLAIAVVLGATAFLFFGVRSDREEVQVALDEAVQDSARFADLIARTALLTARRDSIAQRVSIIQGIDQRRYVWPHLLDELARALPDYTWTTDIVQTIDDPITVRINGQAGNNFALTVFMEQLEASAFLQGVTLIESQQEFVGSGGAQQVVTGFTLELQYVQPPMEFLQTVPLFEGATAATLNEVDSASAPGAPPAGREE
jgi:Tfp pilus assembly protein PilN